jgi:hypothetical protein
MNEFTAFEKKIKQTYRLPEIEPIFISSLEAKLKGNQPNPDVKIKRTYHFARGWAYALGILFVLCTLMLAIGPSRVWAQIQTVLGFIPGFGLVDTSSPLRQLAEPVSRTKDGITIAIKSAFLSADQTTITYNMSELPASIKRVKFGDPECMKPASLIFPDGSQIESSGSGGRAMPDGSFLREVQFLQQIPQQFNQVILVFPCLEGTARGKGPQDWQISLKFKPAPNDIVIYPATLMPPQAKIDTPAPVVTKPENESAFGSQVSTPTMPAVIVDGDHQDTMTVLSVIEKQDSYWVTWGFTGKYDKDVHRNGQLYEMTFNPVLYDANGKEFPEPSQETRQEIWKYEEGLLRQLPNNDTFPITFQIPKTRVAFPIYVKQNVFERSFPEKETYADIEFDGSQVLTADQPLVVDKNVQIGSVHFKLVSIGKSQYGGYTFNFDGQDSKVITAEARLVGHESNFHGSVSFNPNDPYHFAISEMYPQIPTGIQTVRVSYPVVLGDKISFIGTWMPDPK